jgi:hypothetical protein
MSGKTLSTAEQYASTHVISYMGLRQVVGLLAIALPLVLVIGEILLDGPGMERSISAYYYTSMRDVMVGTLCAIAIFLLSYRGYDRRDDIAGDLACAFAVGIALFPTAPQVGASSAQLLAGQVHSLCAGAFFLTLAYFSYCLFTKGDNTSTPRKVWRARIYRTCGVIILLCAIGLGAVKLLPEDSPLHQLSPVFWFEAVGIWAFGWSWFTKGEGILRDEEA